MSTLIAVAVVGLVGAACLGAGAAVLAGLGVFDDLERRERPLWAFAVGFGVFGWLVFLPAVAGQANPPVLLAVAAVCALATPLLARAMRAEDGSAAPRPLDALGWTLVVLVAAVLVLDLLEALAPPADADSLAYHFDHPKRFLEAGGLVFVPRAVDGTAPMIVHMTYLAPLALGGETGLTLWTMLTGWAAAAFVYVLARRHVGVNLSLAAGLVLLTTPALVYAGGSGQVEPRLALFAMVGAFAAAEAVAGGRPAFAVLAGLGAGFFAAGKYTGLLFVAACGIVLVLGRRRLVHGAGFALGAALAGIQWYAWNAAHTGDPVFPMLFGLLGADAELWNARQDAFFRAMFFGSEVGVPADLSWFLAYPFKATLDGAVQFESRRTGLGPFVLLVLPFAAAGAWRWRRELSTSRLLPVCLIVAVFYGLWFFGGSSQRVRHLVPVYPLLLLAVWAAAARWAAAAPKRLPLAAACALTIAVQAAGHGLFALKYVRHQVSGEGRQAFLERNVYRYGIVPWINRNLGPDDRLLHGFRQINYLLEVPYHFAPPALQARINLRPDRTELAPVLVRLRRLGITHVAAPPVDELPPPGASGLGLAYLVRDLLAAGCLAPGPVLEGTDFASRTLPMGRAVTRVQIMSMTGDGCAP